MRNVCTLSIPSLQPLLTARRIISPDVALILQQKMVLLYNWGITVSGCVQAYIAEAYSRAPPSTPTRPD